MKPRIIPRMLAITTFLVIVSLVLGACAAPPAPETIQVEVIKL